MRQKLLKLFNLDNIFIPLFKAVKVFKLITII